MDAQTVNYYSGHAADVAAQYLSIDSPARRYFTQAFLPGTRVLDIGCGSGRELHALLAEGYDAYGVDPVVEMLAAARLHFPSVAERLQTDSLPNLKTIPDGSQDGLLCWATLMHLPEQLLFDVVFNLRRILKSGGRLLISTPIDGPIVDTTTHRDVGGRLFNGVTPENYHFLLAKVGFRLLNRWDTNDSLGRSGRRWATQLFVLEGEGSRSLEKIETILNRDKKDATYKPALFRALAELATNSYHVARWLPEGRVAIPMSLIADKWLEYFWPLFESPTFIPQKHGEKPGCRKPVAFRAELEKLISVYRQAGGLCRFSVDYRGKSLPPAAKTAHARVLSKLCDTIRDGPVFHSGGGGSGTFTYDRSSRNVVLNADLWRELSTMGDWIADATILRWAELTSKISGGDLKPSQVVDQLLTAPIPEREVTEARSFYETLSAKVCVWTDSDLKKAFDVDHAIPFTLWRNNDLWNLFPALPEVNNQKRDRLPSRSLLQRRKDCMIDYWSRMRERHQHRFSFEIGKLIGSEIAISTNWENRLFNAVAEAVEFTAIQRGAERWEPNAQRTRRCRAKPLQKNTPIVPSPNLHVPDIIILDPSADHRFITCVPFYEVEAAAGEFGPEQPGVDPDDHHTWIRITDRRLTKDMFAIRVKGRSMEPLIPDDSVCLFRGDSALAGSRHGRNMLFRLRDGVDPETGGRLTVKRYYSEKVHDEDGGFRHTRIVLQPLNSDFKPIVIDSIEDDALKAIGEFVAVIKAGPEHDPGGA
ncbi:MAG: methyltransferase domain-containing protein [Verrucomicrobiota bacterium]